MASDGPVDLPQPEPSPAAYPTPPPTTSPKQRSQDYPFPPKGAAVDYYDSSYRPQITPYPPHGAHGVESGHRDRGSDSDTVIGRPLNHHGLPNGYPDHRPLTPTRKAARPHTPLGGSRYSPAVSPSRRSSPSIRAAGRPLSPLHRSATPLSPYNASRPRPRAGLQRSLLDRLSNLGSWLLDMGKSHPLLAGLLTFIPVVLGAVGYKAFRAMGGDKKDAGDGIMAKIFGVLGGGGGGAGQKGMRESLFKAFTGFGGVREEKGMLHGFMKMFQMMINHWCRLTLHPFPRTAAILLDVFFVEHGKKP